MYVKPTSGIGRQVFLVWDGAPGPLPRASPPGPPRCRRGPGPAGLPRWLGACGGARRGHRWSPFPDRAQGAARRRSGLRRSGLRARAHRRLQHRRRPHPARAADLPRPRHRDVHPRRGYRHRARLGPAGRDVAGERGALGVRRRPGWFGLGDRDIATHLVRTRMLDAGYPLSAVTEALCARWQPGVRLLPMSDERVETHVVVDLDEDAELTPGAPAGGRSTSRSGGCATTPSSPRTSSSRSAWSRRSPRRRARRDRGRRRVLLAPSNPVVSVGTILGVPGLARRGPLGAGAGRRTVPDRRRRTGARDGRRLPVRDRRRRPPPRRSAGTTAPGARTACSTAGSWTPRTPAHRPGGDACATSRC